MHLPDFPPKNIIEELVLERIAVSYVKMLRVSKAEAEHVKYSLGDESFIDPFCFNKDSYSPKFSYEQFASLVNLFYSHLGSKASEPCFFR